MKKSVKSILVLVIICLTVGVMLSVVNYYTAPIIRENQENDTNESLKKVLPEADSFEAMALPEGAPATVRGIFKDTAGTGYALTMRTSSQYSNGDMLFTMGVDNEGKIIKIVITNYTESKDFRKENYEDAFVGKDQNLSGVDTVAGVTFSSTAFKNAVADGLKTLAAIKGEGQIDDSNSESGEEDVPASLKQVLPAADDFELLPLPKDAPDTVLSVYKDKGGTGYALTMCTSTRYSKEDMLFTMGVDNEGKITRIVITNYTESKDFRKENYEDAFVGKDQDLSGVDTVAGVTFSSTAFKNAVADGLKTLAAIKNEG